MRPPFPLSPLRRWTINVLCAASLLIFLLAMGIWVRSYFACDEMGRITINARTLNGETVRCARGLMYASSRGAVRIGGRWQELRGGVYLPPGFYRDARKPVDLSSGPPMSQHPTYFQLGRFQLVHSPFPNPYGPASDTYLNVPLWLFLLFAIPPVLWVRRYRRKRGRGFPVEVKLDVPPAPA